MVARKYGVGLTTYLIELGVVKMIVEQGIGETHTNIAIILDVDSRDIKQCCGILSKAGSSDRSNVRHEKALPFGRLLVLLHTDRLQAPRE